MIVKTTMNTNDEEITISPGITKSNHSNTTISVSTMETSYGCICIQSPYSIDFTKTPEIQSILGYDSNVLENRIDNPQRYYVNLNWNQIDVNPKYLFCSYMYRNRFGYRY